jgi:hypothetical protein
LLPPYTTTVVVLVALTPASTFACVPGSPDPVSPEVSCHGVGPSSKPVKGLATRVTVPGATQMVDEVVEPGVVPVTGWPFAVREHQVK